MDSTTPGRLNMAPAPNAARLYQNIHSTDNSRVHLGDVYHNHRSSDERALKAILESLSYPGMTDRRDALAEAHEKTFDWTFLDGETKFLVERDRDGDEQWDRYKTVDMSFKSWLQQQYQGLFCVMGKPGSGKSTFMKTLAANSEATTMLQTWADGAILLRSDHFFWILGAPMQKSVEGLLRDILHSVLLGLSQCEEAEIIGVIKYVCGSRWQSATSNSAWSRSELKQMLIRLDSVPKVKSFFLIDALDECEPQDRLYDLVSEILWMSQLSNVKLCVSCRPWDVFTRKLESSVSIRLDQLTRRDMETYIEARLTTTEEEKGLASEFRDRTSTAKQFIQGVARSAEGVFLWTELVVTAMCSEMRKRGSKVERLTHIVSDFPADLDEYFHRLIFNRIGRSRRNVEDTAAALRLALVIHASIERADTAFPQSHPFADSYMNFWLLSDDHLKPNFSWMDIDCITQPSIPQMLDQTASYLQETCNDLLVLNHATKKVAFIHRTVFDFLSDNNVHDTLEQNALSHFSDEGFVFNLARLRCLCLLRTENVSCWSLISALDEVLMRYKHLTHMDQNVDWLSKVESVTMSQMRVNHHCSYWYPLPDLTGLSPNRCMKAGLNKFLLELCSHVPAIALDLSLDDVDLLGKFLQVTNQPEIRNSDLSLLQHILEIGCDPNTTIENWSLQGMALEFHDENCIPTAWTAWLGETFILFIKTMPRSDEPQGMLVWRKRQAAAIIVLLLQHGANPHCMVCVSRHIHEECRLVALDQLMEAIAPAESLTMLRDLRELCSDQTTGYALRRNQRRRAVRSMKILERFYERSAKDADAPEHHSPHRKLVVMDVRLECRYLVSMLFRNMANLRYALCNRCLSRKCALLVATWCLDCGGRSILCSTCLHCNPSESPELGYPCGGCIGDRDTAIGSHTSVPVIDERHPLDDSDEAFEDWIESVQSRYPTAQAISTIKEWYAKDPIEPDLSFEDVVRNTRLSSPQPPHRTQQSGIIFGEVVEEQGGKSNRPWLL